MGTVHTTVTLESRSGAARDRVVNGFTFGTPAAPTDFDLLNIEAELLNFYNATPAGGFNAVGKYISGVMSRAIPPVIRHYDVSAHLNGNAAGSPIKVVDMGDNLTTPAASNNAPAECAIALSYAADFGGDVEFGGGLRPRARDRGRVYIGPLTLGAFATNGTTGRCFVDPVVQGDLAFAGLALINSTTVNWHVWSRAAATTKLVTRCWVDDEPDTQRRRGGVTTNRLVKP